MKTRDLLFAGALLLSPLTHAQDKPAIVLWEDNFEKPTEITLNFPPSEGVPFRRLNSSMLPWANKGGQLSVTYGMGYGKDRSGGLFCNVLKSTDSSGYIAVNLESVTLPVSSPDLVGTYLRGVTVTFEMNLPVDKIVEIFLQPVEIPEEYKALAMSRKLHMARIVGTGEYTTYSYRAGNVMLANADGFIRFYQDCLTAGMTAVAFNVIWHLPGGKWEKNEGFLLDDIKVSVVR